jgi:putative effector of murein hydrolase
MSGPTSEAFISLIPFSVVTLIFFVFSIPLSRRKGKSFIYPMLCLIPFLTIFILLYLVRLTDKQILDRLNALESKTQ